MRSSKTDSVLSELVTDMFGPAFESTLGASARIETNEVVPNVGRDGWTVRTAVSPLLPLAYKTTVLQPDSLVKVAPQAVLEEIVQGHYRPFQRMLEQALRETTATWLMAIGEPRRDLG